MNIRPIRTEQDYKDALKSVSPLFDNEPQPGTPEGDYLEVMITLIEAYEAKRREADVANAKKGSLNVSITINVVKAHTLADPLEDKDALVGRKHFESYNVLTEYGQAQLVKLILGVLGIGFKDKEAMATLGRNPLSLLEELQTNKVAFGFTIKNSVSAAGYENCNIVLKSAAFINMERAFEMLS